MNTEPGKTAAATTCAALLFAGALLCGCASLAHKPAAQADTPQIENETRRLLFVDLDSFDRSLEQALGSGASVIEIEFAGAMSPNSISPRLGRWINTIQENGGKLDVSGQQRTRALSLIASLIDAVQAGWTDMQHRGLVKNFDVQMTLNNQEIALVTFKRRVNQAGGRQ